jgi:drug/metabolite transporter (DMT)-like permease
MKLSLAHHKHGKNVPLGIFWALISCFCSGIMVNMVKHVAVDMNTVEIIFFRNVFAFLMFVPIIAYTGFAKFKTHKIKIHILRSITGLISMMIFFFAISKMSISVVTAMSFTAPLFTAIMAVYFFKDKMNVHQMFALFVGFVGVLIVVQPGTEAFKPVGLLVLISAVFWALSSIIIKKLAETEKPIVTTFYMTFFMIIFSAPIAMYNFEQPTPEQYMWVFGIALTSNFLQYGLSKSLTYADLSVLLPFDFTRLIFGAGIAYWFFGEDIDVNAALGSVIIIAAAFYTAITERRRVRKLTEYTQTGKTV